MSGQSGAAIPSWAGSPCGFGEKSAIAEVDAGAYTVGVLSAGLLAGLEAGSARAAVAGTMGDGGLGVLRAWPRAATVVTQDFRCTCPMNSASLAARCLRRQESCSQFGES
jgi:hypothetical protein